MGSRVTNLVLGICHARPACIRWSGT